MAEQLICNQQVDGSTPFTSSIEKQNIFYGGIPERPKGADCKSVVTDFAGPNPASPTKRKYRVIRHGIFVWSGSRDGKRAHLCARCAAYRSRKVNLEELSLRGILPSSEQNARLRTSHFNHHKLFPERQYPASRKSSPCFSIKSTRGE